MNSISPSAVLMPANLLFDEVEDAAAKMASKWREYAGNANQDMSEKIAYRYLVIYLSEQQKIIQDIQVMNQVIERTMCLANNTLPGGQLTIRDLKQKIHNLPDDMPVMIEVSKHQGRNMHLVEWERSIISKAQYEELIANPISHVSAIELDGKYFMRTLIDYDHAFSAMISKNEAGEKAFCIHSSY